MLKLIAIVLLIAMFPMVALGIILGLLAHPLFFLLLLLLLVALPSIVVVRQPKAAGG